MKLNLATILCLVLIVFNSYGGDGVNDESNLPITSSRTAKTSLVIAEKITFSGLPEDVHLRIMSSLPELTDFARFALINNQFSLVAVKFFNTLVMGHVVVIGRTGIGKSTLVYVMKGETLKATPPDPLCDWKLNSENSISSVKIVHGTSTGTLHPSPVWDSKSKRIIWDCPGFQYAQGTEQDYLNALEIYKQLQRRKLRVILVVEESTFEESRGQNFSFLINKMTEIFPIETQLHNVLSLVVSKSRSNRGAAKDLEIHMENPRYLTENGAKLVNFLMSNSNHVAQFPAPNIEGRYTVNEHLMTVLQSENYVDLPTVNIPIKHDVLIRGGWSLTNTKQDNKKGE